ncbi:Flagellin C [uncultured Pleomorphomonas sp.]|uniref:Flagellin n=1 Tax=uncultured Pleomorphomonas sp. TaxID=442121 RepID=A0A212LBC6_9HYPH|nr:flagellin [uncultured Pleomorphomonas sp.]SCM74873.1 Flagellin C [uncultured Pleomorphomonas sp.]
MASLLTNAAAMTALQTLASTNKSLDTTQNRISTGLRISSAADGAAYWSIATTMRSDNKSLSAVQDSLGLGAATVDVQYTALDATVDQLTEIGKLLVSAKTPGVNRGQIQEDIKARLGQINSIASSSVFNSENWLSVDSSAADYNKDKSVVASFSRVGDAISIETITVDVNEIKLYDANATPTTVGTAPTAAADGAVKMTDKGLFDSEWQVWSDGLATPGVVSLSIADLDISGLSDSADDQATLSAYISIVDAALGSLTDAASNLGAVKNRIDTQKDFVQSLTDAIDRGIGQLVDADMNAESTRLQALQTQQQLGIQALSIANSNSQNILSLFRG